MKTYISKLFLSSLIFVLGAESLSAQSIVTIQSGVLKQVVATDVIEILGYGESASGYLSMDINGYGGALPLTYTSGTVSNPVSADRRGTIISGVTRLLAVDNWVTVKITSLSNLAPFQPSNVAVIPENASGVYNVILESSVDMVTWNPVNPGNYGGNTPARFFRTRIVKNP